MRCIEGLHAERELHRQVTDLAVCGVRPLTIRAIMGHCISLSEIARIFKLATYLEPNERRGRGISPSNLRRMDPAHLKLYSLLVVDLQFCIESGATKADALAAVWRVETARRGLPWYSSIGGATLEDLATIYINMEIGELEFITCPKCAARILRQCDGPSACRCEQAAYWQSRLCEI